MTIISDDIAIVFEKCFLNSKRSVKRLCVCLFVCVCFRDWQYCRQGGGGGRVNPVFMSWAAASV